MGIGGECQGGRFDGVPEGLPEQRGVSGSKGPTQRGCVRNKAQVHMPFSTVYECPLLLREVGLGILVHRRGIRSDKRRLLRQHLRSRELRREVVLFAKLFEVLLQVIRRLQGPSPIPVHKGLIQ